MSRKVKIHNIDWLKRSESKIYRYFRLVRLFFNLHFSKQKILRTASEIARVPKETPGIWFEADIFNLADIVRFSRTETKFINSQTATEVLSIFPLCMEMVIATGERYVIGKLINSDTPIDVFMAPERFVEKNGKKANIYSATYIQTKRLRIHPSKPLTKKEWADELQKLVYRTVIDNDFGIKCEINFRNEILFSEEINDKGFAEIFKKLIVPRNKHIQGISISIPVYDTLLKSNTFRTWYIWPKVFPTGTLNETMAKVRDLYTGLAIADILINHDKKFGSK